MCTSVFGILSTISARKLISHVCGLRLSYSKMLICERCIGASFDFVVQIFEDDHSLTTALISHSIAKSRFRLLSSIKMAKLCLHDYWSTKP